MYQPMCGSSVGTSTMGTRNLVARVKSLLIVRRVLIPLEPIESMDSRVPFFWKNLMH